MTMPRRVVVLLSAGLAITMAASAACHGRPHGEHAGVLSIVRGETDAAAPADAPMPARGEVGPSVPAHVATGVAPFSVLARQPRIAKAPCVTCHTQPLAAMRWSGAHGRPSAHWQIELQHAAPSVMTCTTCHAPASLDELRTLTGAAVAFDHAYETCAQCHSKQRSDWEGGAHGKRAGGWTPPRVVYNCTECHNPHSPAFPSRWPARAGRSASDR